MREGDEARKRAEEYKSIMVEERRKFLQNKEKQRKEMMQEIRNFEQRRNGKFDLLDKREFGINRQKLLEMGIFQ